MADTAVGIRKDSGYLTVDNNENNHSLPTTIETASSTTNNISFNEHGCWIILRQILCSRVCVAVVLSFVVGIFVGMSAEEQRIGATTTSSSTLVQQQQETTKTGAILVTGATGRTGSLLYHELKRRAGAGDAGGDVRAFVRDVAKAKTVLGCVACDETEGIYVGDVTQPETLERALSDGSVTTLAIAVGGSPRYSHDMQRQVEFDSVVYSVHALTNNYHQQHDQQSQAQAPLKVVLCSSMGTNTVPSPAWAGDVLFWKLNAETFLSTAAIPNTIIVKPCGLSEVMAGNNSTLLVGHNGTIMVGSEYHTVSRQDVANVMAEAVVMEHHQDGKSTNLRFDLCSRPGPATTDLKGLIDSARWEWD